MSQAGSGIFKCGVKVRGLALFFQCPHTLWTPETENIAMNRLIACIGLDRLQCSGWPGGIRCLKLVRGFVFMDEY